MNKETTYQRLKRENAELRDRLYKVIMQPDTEEAILIKAEIVMQAAIERAVFMGDAGPYIQIGIKTKEKCG